MTHDYIWNYRINCYLYIHVFNTCIPKKVCSSDFYWTAQFFLPRSRTEDRSSSAEPNKSQLYSGPRSPVGSALSPPADTDVEKLAECLTVFFCQDHFVLILLLGIHVFPQSLISLQLYDHSIQHFFSLTS